ncbi:sugar transferase [Merdimonas faecis]|uniref:sugar transferase n=1 Tax=Merdimonas faecis TaxID=1653435 RepID=UPI0008637271|nr:sugar transferase [Merdimonas faecis]
MYAKYIKRIVDIVVALTGLPFFAIIFVIIAPIIYLSDKEPVFYNAPRLGKKGKVFYMYKFRSMKVNAPDIRNADGSTYNAEDDPRVTSIGKLMRKTSLDEIPQLLNVLIGDMSIIGPRPFVPVEGKENTSKNFQDRLLVRPGITGYTQAYFRNSISQEEKIKMDAEYARNVTFLGDMKILLKTIETVAQRKNIYNK